MGAGGRYTKVQSEQALAIESDRRIDPLDEKNGLDGSKLESCLLHRASNFDGDLEKVSITYACPYPKNKQVCQG